MSAAVRTLTAPAHGDTLRRCAESVKSALVDPRRVCERLGLIAEGRRSKVQRSYVLVCCPVHDERNPSCSVFARGGAIGCHCHGCGWGGDVLSLVAAVHGLNVRADFRDVLSEAATLAGIHQLVETIRGRSDYVPRVPPRRAEPLEVVDYPPPAEVERFWGSASDVSADAWCARYFGGRALGPGGLQELVRCQTGYQPSWARYQGSEWRAEGFTAVSPVYDHTGTLRSVRAWRVLDSDGPKRLPPAGHRASGLVLANTRAVIMLRERALFRQVVIAEGEPDWATLSVRWPEAAVLGVFSGSWTAELAERIPRGALVLVRTHTDEAGDRYARAIVKALHGRAVVRRMT